MCSGGVRGITVLCHLSRCSTAILISVNSTKTSSVGPMRPWFVATCATAAGRSSAKGWSPFCISDPADHGVCTSITSASQNCHCANRKIGFWIPGKSLRPLARAACSADFRHEGLGRRRNSRCLKVDSRRPDFQESLDPRRIRPCQSDLSAIADLGRFRAYRKGHHQRLDRGGSSLVPSAEPWLWF